jgi:hypothetical protein
MTPAAWDTDYLDLPNKLVKVLVRDRNAFKVTDAERKLVEPKGLQARIDALVAKYEGGRSFVRPSGTEDCVRVYAEAQRKGEADGAFPVLCPSRTLTVVCRTGDPSQPSGDSSKRVKMMGRPYDRYDCIRYDTRYGMSASSRDTGVTMREGGVVQALKNSRRVLVKRLSASSIVASGGAKVARKKLERSRMSSVR